MRAEEPPGLHALELKAHRGDAATAGLSASPVRVTQRTLTSTPAGPCKTIFGYLPYWESSANLRYNLLTHIACFSVEVNSNGTLGNLHGWPWTTVVNSAHTAGVKIILVATLMDTNALYTLLTTPAYKAAFFTNIKAQVLAGNADGVNIDFEAGSNTPNWKAYINAFMADLTTYMHAQVPGSEVSFAGPAVNWSSSWDLPGLAANCDYIFIMGYDFYGSWSSTSGPSAPLTPAPGGTICITNTVDVQYGTVTRNNPEKLILGVPYYGNHWTTTGSGAYAGVKSYVGVVFFRNEQSATYGLLWDTYSQTAWYRWQDASNVWHQVWFDNAESLGRKFQLAQDRNYRGVGMWALNYDGTRSELWDELDRRFVAGCPIPVPDFDGDGDVDQVDFGYFQACFHRSFDQTPPGCAKALLDGDTDVDRGDFLIFERCMKGPGVNADPTCTQ